MKYLIICLSVAISMGGFAFAEEPADGTRDLLNAISLCDSVNNPIAGLKKLGANKFGEAYTSENTDMAPNSKLISVVAISSPHSQNLAIMASDTDVGVITVSTTYENKGPVNRLLKCVLTVKKN